MIGEKMDNNLKEQLAEEMLNLREDIEQGYAFWERTGENRQILVNKFSELLAISEELQQTDPGFYANFEETRFDGKGLLKALNVLNTDLREGLGKAIENVSGEKEETVVNLAEHFKSNEHYTWQSKNPTAKISKVINNLNEEAKIDKLLQEFLPSVKAEEMSDLLALAVSGKLSESYTDISQLSNKEEQITYVKKLMAKERLHIKVDFSSLEITDETERHKQENLGGRLSARGIAAQSMIDSAFLSSDKKELVCVCSTANKDTASQRDQLYRIFHTLNEAKAKGDLLIAGAENPDINLVVYNRAFFCTQDKEEANSYISAGPKGGSKKVNGFHFASGRAEFEKLIAPGQEVSKEEMDKINGLATLSMIGNGLSYPRFPYTFEVSDIVNANPFTVGADTLWLKEKFEEIRAFTGQEREQKFFEFMVDFANDTVDVLNKLKTDVQISSDSVQTPLIKNLAESLGRTLTGMAENFSSYNLGEEYVRKTNVFDKLENLEKAVDLFNEKHPNTKLPTAPVEALTNDRGFIKRGNKIIEARKAQEADFCRQWNTMSQGNPLVKEANTKSVKEVLFNFSMQILGSDSPERNSIQDLHQRIDDLAKHLYSNDSSLNRENRVPVYKYFLAAASGLMSLNSKEDQGDCYAAFRNNTYFTKTKELTNPSSPKRKNFNNRVEAFETKNPGSSEGLKEADKLILRFMNKVSSNEGAMEIVRSGGYELALTELITNLENQLGNKNTKNVKLK